MEKARIVTDAEKRELEAEYRKVEVLMSYEEIIAGEADLAPLIAIYDELKEATNKVNECYENEKQIVFGSAFGVLKSAETEITTRLYQEIDRVFGINQETAQNVYTMLTHGRIQSAHDFNVKYQAQKDCLAEAGLL